MAGEITIVPGYAFVPDSQGKIQLTRDALNRLGTPQAQLNDGAVTEEKLHPALELGTSRLADKAVTSEKLDDDAVIADKIADNAVEGRHLNDLAVTEDKINDGAVTTDKIADASVTKDKLDLDNITLELHKETYDRDGGLGDGIEWTFETFFNNSPIGRIVQAFVADVSGDTDADFTDDAKWVSEDLRNSQAMKFKFEEYDSAGEIWKGDFYSSSDTKVYINDATTSPNAPKVRPGCKVVLTIGAETKRFYITFVESESEQAYIKSVHLKSDEDPLPSPTVGSSYACAITAMEDIEDKGQVTLTGLGTLTIVDVPIPTKSDKNNRTVIKDENYLSTTQVSSNFKAAYGFDDILRAPTNGAASKKAWQGKFFKVEDLTKKPPRYTTNRVNIDLEAPYYVNQIEYVNYHNNGGNTDIGAKEIELYGSDSSESWSNTDPTENEGWELIQEFTLDKAEKGNKTPALSYMTVNATKQYRYYSIIIKTNYGNGTHSGFRRILFRGNNPAVPVNRIFTMTYTNPGFDCSDWNEITGLFITEEKQSQNIWYLFSFDENVSPTPPTFLTWKYFDSVTQEWKEAVRYNVTVWEYSDGAGSWTPATDNSMQSAISEALESSVIMRMVKTDLEVFESEEWNGSDTGFIRGTTQNIGVAVCMKSTNETSVPSVSEIEFNAAHWRKLNEKDEVEITLKGIKRTGVKNISGSAINNKIKAVVIY
jgi:hypothetical protein